MRILYQWTDADDEETHPKCFVLSIISLRTIRAPSCCENDFCCDPYSAALLDLLNLDAASLFQSGRVGSVFLANHLAVWNSTEQLIHLLE